jgi:hypothetical protein
LTQLTAFFSAGALHFFVYRSSRTDSGDFHPGFIGTVDDPISADSQTPISLQFSFKRFSAGGVSQDIVEGEPNFSFHFGV